MRFSLILLASAISAPLVSAHADEVEHPFSLSFGGLWNEVDAAFASTVAGRDRVELDFNNLGMDDKATVFWTEGQWRFSRRWTAGLSYSSFSSDGFVDAEFDGNYDDVEWRAGASLDTSFNMDLAIANVTWDFLSTDKTRAGIGVGVHTAAMDFDITARATVEVGDGVFQEVVETGRRSVLAPLPNLALTASHEFSDDLRLVGFAGVFSLSVDKYDGSLVSTRVALEWFPWDNVGIGGAVQYIDTQLEIERTNRVDEFDVEFFGPIAYATFRF